MTETIQIGNRSYDRSGHTYVCGILNVTPDSFSDGGKWNGMDTMLSHCEQMIAEGAELIDVGGESTRPGHTQISDQEEIERIGPALEALKDRFDIPFSLDTYKTAVAAEGIRAGADLINDIWGLRYEDTMASVIAKAGIPCCLMHNRSVIKKQDDLSSTDTLLLDIHRDLQESLSLAEAAGISKDKIILDPGVGFGKTLEENLQVIRSLQDFKTLGYPLLLGTSRKSVIGLTLDLPVTEREEGTLVTTVMAVQAGYMFVRVHDVKANVRAVRMTEAILQS